MSYMTIGYTSGVYGHALKKVRGWNVGEEQN